jgi:hypothetical protein
MDVVAETVVDKTLKVDGAVELRTDSYTAAMADVDNESKINESKEHRDEATLKRDLFRLKWVIAGSLVDSIGSTGFSYAMGTLMVLRFPCLANSYTTILAVVVVVYLVGFAIGTPIMMKFGFGASTVFGNVASVIFQILIAFAMVSDCKRTSGFKCLLDYAKSSACMLVRVVVGMCACAWEVDMAFNNVPITVGC